MGVVPPRAGRVVRLVSSRSGVRVPPPAHERAARAPGPAALGHWGRAAGHDAGLPCKTVARTIRNEVIRSGPGGCPGSEPVTSRINRSHHDSITPPCGSQGRPADDGSCGWAPCVASRTRRSCENGPAEPATFKKIRAGIADRSRCGDCKLNRAVHVSSASSVIRPPRRTGHAGAPRGTSVPFRGRSHGSYTTPFGSASALPGRSASARLSPRRPGAPSPSPSWFWS